MIRNITRRAITLDVPRHRIRHAVRQMHSGVSKPDSRIRRRQQHIGARFVVRWILHRSNNILRHHPQRLQRPDIADGIRSLIRRANQGPIRIRPAGVRHRCIRLDGVAQNIQAARRCHLRRHAASIIGVQQSQGRFQAAARDAGLGVHANQVENADARRLAAGARSGWNRKQRLQRAGDGQPLADGRIHVIQKIGRRISNVQVDGLRGVDGGSAAHRHKRVDTAPVSRTRWRPETIRR